MGSNNYQFYVNYYKQQAGSGLSGYQGLRYQRGGGFFGRLLSNAIYPVLRYLGKQALHTGVNIAGDVLENKVNIKEAAKRRFKETAKTMASDAIAQAQSRLQLGQGRRKRKRRSKAKKIKLVVKKKVIKRKTKQRKRKRKTTRKKRSKRSSKKSSSKFNWL